MIKVKSEALDKYKYCLKRIFFLSAITFSLFTIIGGIICLPLMSFFFGKSISSGRWRYFKNLILLYRLIFWGWHKFIVLILGEQKHKFLLSVPLSAPPRDSPDKNIVQLRKDWQFGASCGNCTICCGDKLKCPLLDKKTNLCLGYKSFYWYYFNCGRFPSTKQEIDYYECPKWEILHEDSKS